MRYAITSEMQFSYSTLEETELNRLNDIEHERERLFTDGASSFLLATSANLDDLQLSHIHELHQTIQFFGRMDAVEGVFINAYAPYIGTLKLELVSQTHSYS